jgi:hypothetical protein
MMDRWFILQEEKMYHESENNNWEAALLVVVRDERRYLAAGDLDFRVRLTYIAIVEPCQLIDMILMPRNKYICQVNVIILVQIMSKIHHDMLSNNPW